MKKLCLLLLQIGPFLLNAQSIPEVKAPARSLSDVVPLPKQNFKIGIRCASILKPDTTGEPLIVIDDFPFDGSLKDVTLKPSQIESITIIKDIAASSIWGVRAGNGVILIKSKYLDSVKTIAPPATAKQIDNAINTRSRTRFVTQNPVGGKFSISLYNDAAPFKLSLVNMQGQILRTWQKSSSSGKLHEFDITGISPGIYIAYLQVAGLNSSEKILISQ